MKTLALLLALAGAHKKALPAPDQVLDKACDQGSIPIMATVVRHLGSYAYEVSGGMATFVVQMRRRAFRTPGQFFRVCVNETPTWEEWETQAGFMRRVKIWTEWVPSKK